MAFVKKDRVRETSTTTGTGPLTLAGTLGGYQRFSAVMSVSDTCWYCIVLPGSAWEVGLGTYTGTNTLTRTTIYESSNAGSAVNFGAGTKDVFMGLPASRCDFIPGTLMLFQQTSAPPGWTKQTTHNDKALRVVSGTASSGGTNAFSTVMAQTTVGSTTIATGTMPSHSHFETQHSAVVNTDDFQDTAHFSAGGNGGSLQSPLSTQAEGGGGSHNHTVLMAIQYVDLIIASKD